MAHTNDHMVEEVRICVVIEWDVDSLLRTFWVYFSNESGELDVFRKVEIGSVVVEVCFKFLASEMAASVLGGKVFELHEHVRHDGYKFLVDALKIVSICAVEFIGCFVLGVPKATDMLFYLVACDIGYLRNVA